MNAWYGDSGVNALEFRARWRRRGRAPAPRVARPRRDSLRNAGGTERRIR